MSTSTIRIKKTCKWCGKQFEAQKVTTQYCCKRCAEHAYKDRMKQERKKVTEARDKVETFQNKASELEGREYLSVAETAVLLNVSRRAVYNLIYRGTLRASRISGQWTVIKKSDIELMVAARPYQRQPKASTAVVLEEQISEFYTTKEIIEKFGVSNSWVFAQGKAHNIPKIYHRGKTLWSKAHCDRVFKVKQEPKEEEWISYSDVRAEYNLTHDQLHNYVKYHGLRRKKIGKYTYILRSEIDALLRPPTLK